LVFWGGCIQGKGGGRYFHSRGELNREADEFGTLEGNLSGAKKRPPHLGVDRGGGGEKGTSARIWRGGSRREKHPPARRGVSKTHERGKLGKGDLGVTKGVVCPSFPWRKGEDTPREGGAPSARGGKRGKRRKELKRVLAIARR